MTRSDCLSYNFYRMLLPKKKLNEKGPASPIACLDSAKLTSQSGQMLIILLLILVIGLATVLAIASRTVTDIRQATTSDECNRAYFAAEAGIQKALQSVSSGNFTLDFNSLNNSQTSVTKVNAGGSDPFFAIPNPIGKDDYVQFYLMSNYQSLATAGVSPSILKTDTLNLYWDDTNSTPGASSPALEITVLQYNGSAFNLSKMAFDTFASRGIFCSTGVTTPSGRADYKYKVAISLSSPACNNDAVTQNPVLMRVRLLYNTTPVKLALEKFGGGNLPQQGSVITSTGSTSSGVTRKLVVTSLYPSLPSLFDYALFNGSTTNSLSK